MASKRDESTAQVAHVKQEASASPSSRGVASNIAVVLFATQWPLILGLIAGGCCSNAYFLELGTAAVPTAGTLITFAQFLATALTCIPSQLEWLDAPDTVAKGGANHSRAPRRRLPRFKKPKVPITRWSIQVLLYLSTSLLNNAAFAYDIPMSVHIVFRSGGLVINMILGWAVEGRRYNLMQILSVFIVTVGVIAATLFAQNPPPPIAEELSRKEEAAGSIMEKLAGTVSSTYIFGVSLLFLALVLSGLMGLYQERTFQTYGRDNWQEALFYAHTLSLPIFFTRWRRLGEEIRLANQTPPIWMGYVSSSLIDDTLRILADSKAISRDPALLWKSSSSSYLDLGQGCLLRHVTGTGFYYSSGQSLRQCHGNIQFRAIADLGRSSGSSGAWRLSASATSGPHLSILIPSFWPALLLNVLTQLLCINGVNRLTSQVTSLTVTLVLVLRKATSLAISVVWVGGHTGNLGLWSGAGAVLLGTVGYTLASSAGSTKKASAEGKTRRVGQVGGSSGKDRQGTSSATARSNVEANGAGDLRSRRNVRRT